MIGPVYVRNVLSILAFSRCWRWP